MVKSDTLRAVCAGGLIGTGLLAAAVGVTVARHAPAPEATPSPAGITTAASAVYRVVGVWQGKLAVFLPDAATPERVYDVWVSALPDDARLSLEKGVAAADRRELLALIENYSG